MRTQVVDLGLVTKRNCADAQAGHQSTIGDKA